MTRRITVKKRAKVLSLTLLGILLLLIGIGAFIMMRNPTPRTISKETGNATTQVKGNQNQSNFDPKTSSEEAIRNPSQAPASAPTSPSQAAVVKPIITGTDQNQTDFTVDALVSNQSSGTCTATLSRNGYANLSVKTQVTQVTSYYACQTMRFSLSTISRGDWDLAVSFSSNSGSGSSDKQVVSIK